MYETTEGARLHFIKFETKHIEYTLDYIQKSLLGSNNKITGILQNKNEKKKTFFV